MTWQRVNLGFVSAYILARGGQAAIVDTGVGGSAGAIEDSLAEIGLDWSAVEHLILTHRHNDHAGSATEIMEAAPEMAAYAGAEDISAISVPRPLTPVEDGDRVFDLQIVTTPGHTPGSISVYDAVSGLLVAGDALRTEGGRPGLPGGQFTENMDEAIRSVAKLGELVFETLLVGHGEPIESGASAPWRSWPRSSSRRVGRWCQISAHVMIGEDRASVDGQISARLIPGPVNMGRFSIPTGLQVAIDYPD